MQQFNRIKPPRSSQTTSANPAPLPPLHTRIQLNQIKFWYQLCPLKSNQTLFENKYQLTIKNIAVGATHNDQQPGSPLLELKKISKDRNIISEFQLKT
jgi:hypothetical protein